MLQFRAQKISSQFNMGQARAEQVKTKEIDGPLKAIDGTH
jgi:hypothetical protein